jgi:dihydroxyacetone kinase
MAVAQLIDRVLTLERALAAERRRSRELEETAKDAVDRLFRIAMGTDTCSLAQCREIENRIQNVETSKS